MKSGEESYPKDKKKKLICLIDAMLAYAIRLGKNPVQYVHTHCCIDGCAERLDVTALLVYIRCFACMRTCVQGGLKSGVLSILSGEADAGKELFELPVMIKADVQGSEQALVTALRWGGGVVFSMLMSGGGGPG